MSFPRYPKYKASGVEWLGDVPEHWEVWKLTHAVETIGSGTTPKTDVREYYENGSHPWINTGDLNDGYLSACEKQVTDRALSEHTTLRMYPPGSVVIAMYGATIGKLSILGFKAAVNQACCVFAGRSKIDPKFLFFWLLGFRQQIISFATGGGQPNVNQEILRSLRVACPPLAEQTAIAEFLDRETAKIDGLVAEQRRLIALLKEKRQAVISHAVTKGLHPNAPTKPSGIPWLGDVPAGWVTCALKRVVRMQSGESITAESIAETGNYPVYGGNGLRGFTSEFTHNGTYVLIGRQGALCGNINYAFEKFWASEHAVVATPTQPVDTFWLGEMLQAMNLNQYSIAAAQPGLSVDLVGRLGIPLPPLAEQMAIAAYLTKELARFDALTAEADRAIDLLQERRTALISSAVTGQIDVCQHPAN